MAPDQPAWLRVLLRMASGRASDAELGDVVEEYATGARSGRWVAGQIVSIVRRRRSHLTLRERGIEMLSHLRNDIRYALRTLARNPGFAAAAIVPIALGIGLNTALFSILNSVAWRPLPVRDADTLVSIHQDFRGGPRRSVFGARALFSIPEYRAYRDGARTLSDVMAYSRHWSATVHRESPQDVEGILVSCNYFVVLQVSPAIGPGFTPSNCESAAAPPVVVLSHALWTNAFGGDSRILQNPITLNGREVSVVGVAPAGFEGIDMAKAAFFAPVSTAVVFGAEASLIENAHVSWLTLIGRRRGDAAIGQVRADLTTIAHRIDAAQAGRRTSVIVEPAVAMSLPVQRRDALRGAAIVLGAFGLVLLIAAANVANILLARAAARGRELAIRVSVGASRWRLVQQLLTESALIAIIGAAAGTLLFWWSSQALISWLLTAVPGAEPLRLDATPDRHVFWYAIALTFATALVFGLLPARRASAMDVHAAMKQDVGDGRRGRGSMRGLLVGLQVAFCTMLLIPAGLLSRALYAAHRFDPGFEYGHVTVARIALRTPGYDKEGVSAFRAQWIDRIRALPGVEHVATATRIPLSPGRSQTTIRVGDGPGDHVVDVNAVSPGFFPVLGMPIVRGRVFTDDEADAALVTESTARRYWPGQDAIGAAITMDGRRRLIVGIVRDAQVSLAENAVSTSIYVPATPGSERQITVLARTQPDLQSFAAAVRAEARRLDPALVVTVRPLSDNVTFLQTLARIAASGAGLVTALALCLGATGVYGVVAYVVSRRRREVGVRMALGAGARDVQRLILGETLRPVAAGLAIGLAAAAGGAQILRSVLFGVSPYDPVAFIGATALMLVIAAAAALLPTRRALQVDPVSVLRSE